MKRNGTGLARRSRLSSGHHDRVFCRSFACFIFHWLADCFCKCEYTGRQLKQCQQTLKDLIIINCFWIEIQMLSYVYKERNTWYFFPLCERHWCFFLHSKICDNADISGLSDKNTVKVILSFQMKTLVEALNCCWFCRKAEIRFLFLTLVILWKIST